MKKLLSILDLAELLNVPIHYIYRLNSERRGPKITRIGKQTPRYKFSDVEEWLAASPGNLEPSRAER